MKKFNTLIKAILPVSLAVLMASCGGSKGDYRNMLPADSFLTISYNCASVAGKAGISDAEVAALRGNAHMMMGLVGGMIQADDQQLLLSIIDDPENSGLSLRDDMYFFMNFDAKGDMDEPTVGMLAKVKDKKKIDRLVEMLASLDSSVEVRQDRGLEIMVVDEDYYNTVLLAYNDNALMFYRSGYDYATTLRDMADLFDGKGPTMAGDKHFDKFLGSKSDVSMLLSYASVVEIARKQADMAIPFGDVLSNVAIYFNTDFKKGKIETDYGVIFRDPEARKALEETYSTHKLSGRFADLIPADVLFAAAGYINGNNLYTALSNLPQYAFLNMVPAVREIMTAFEGDLFMAFTGLDVQMNDFRGFIAGEVNNRDFVPALVGQLDELPVAPVGEDQYVIDLGYVSGSFGIHDNVFFISNDQVMVEALKGSSVEKLDNDILRHFKNVYGAFYVDINRIVSSVIPAGADLGEMGPALSFVNLFRDIIMYADDPYEGKIILNMVDDDHNAVEAIANEARALVMSNIGAFMPF